MKRLTWAAIAVTLVVLPVVVAAQAEPTGEAVADALRECRVYASATVTARTRQEIEAAQAIAARDKEIDHLRVELARKIVELQKAAEKK